MVYVIMIVDLVLVLHLEIVIVGQPDIVGLNVMFLYVMVIVKKLM